MIARQGAGLVGRVGREPVIRIRPLGSQPGVAARLIDALGQLG
jgi:hypothetical protein